jgi:hypothetical protein
MRRDDRSVINTNPSRPSVAAGNKESITNYQSDDALPLPISPKSSSAAERDTSLPLDSTPQDMVNLLKLNVPTSFESNQLVEGGQEESDDSSMLMPTPPSDPFEQHLFCHCKVI